MNLFKKIFNPKEAVDSGNEEIATQDPLADISLDDAFVQKFITKGGKFLYCTHQEEVNQNLVNIIKENHWEKVVCLNDDLRKILTIVDIECSDNTTLKNLPFFTFCEHLISEDGSVMFSSEQVKEHKILDLPDHFIVFARTSQLVNNKSEGLMGIRKTYQKDFPTNISCIKSYMPERVDEDFLNFGINNAKSLYLLLLEDL